jgi:hypothetical protein
MPLVALLASSLAPFGHFSNRKQVLAVQADIQIPWDVGWQLLNLTTICQEFFERIVHRLPSA